MRHNQLESWSESEKNEVMSNEGTCFGEITEMKKNKLMIIRNGLKSANRKKCTGQAGTSSPTDAQVPVIK